MPESDSEKSGQNSNWAPKGFRRLGVGLEVSFNYQQKSVDPLKVAELVERSEPQARGYLARSTAFKLKALPLQVIVQQGIKRLIVAVVTNAAIDLRQQLTFMTGFPIELVVVEEDVIENALIRLYVGDDQELEESVIALGHFDQKVETRVLQPTIELPDTNEVTRFVTRVIEYGIAHQASDIHFSARQTGSFVQVRIGDELRIHPEPIAGIELHRQIVSRIKVLAGLDTTERMKPQDGRFSFRLQERLIDIRVSSLPTIYGENVVLRLFGLQSIRSLLSLELPTEFRNEIDRCIRHCSCALVVSGPTGSGKTSTLYAIASDLIRKGKCVSTIEDPVEIALEGAVQTSINEDIGFDFVHALPSVLRQDPDVILIGEMRDVRSATVAFNAALSGHLVLSTVHGSNIVNALNRFTYLGIGRILLAQGLGFLMSQRLIDRLCIHCRVFDLRAANSLGLDVYQPVGCPRCNHTGYSGKVLIAEALSFNDAIREFVCRADILTQSLLREHAGSSYWPFKDRMLEHLAKGEISYSQFAEMV